MDQRQQPAGQGGHENRHGENELRAAVNALYGPEAQHGADQHHPLDAEIQHPRALGQQLAKRGEEEWRAVEHARGRDDDEDAVVHAPSATGAGRRASRMR